MQEEQKDQEVKRTRKTMYGNEAVLMCEMEVINEHENKESAEKYVSDNVDNLIKKYGEDSEFNIFVKYRTMKPKVVSKVVFE